MNILMFFYCMWIAIHAFIMKESRYRKKVEFGNNAAYCFISSQIGICFSLLQSKRQSSTHPLLLPIRHFKRHFFSHSESFLSLPPWPRFEIGPGIIFIGPRIRNCCNKIFGIWYYSFFRNELRATLFSTFARMFHQA